uniref:Male-enhanced antigen 1 n=1 Tax=Calidris pygmaea TaxID=425635 RepID=A0A8C3KE90_9CHAR
KGKEGKGKGKEAKGEVKGQGKGSKREGKGKEKERKRKGREGKGKGREGVRPPAAAHLSLQMLRLHLPDPPADSEEEEAAAEEGAVAQSSRSSIPMDAEHVELVKRTMAGVKLPTLGIPAWASQISEDQWKDVVQRTLQARQSLGGPRPEWK